MDKRSLILFDAHCDTASEMIDQNQPLADNSLHFSLRRASEYGGFVQVFAAWVDARRFSDGPVRATDVLENLRREIGKNRDRVAPATSAGDVRRCLAEGRVAALFSIEDGVALGGDLDNLRRFYEMGVRFLTLTWNGANMLADGILVPDGGGLTPFGRAVVREMGRLGMAVDVSHLSRRAFWDVMELAEGPVCATHSNAYAVCAHPRNLTDDQFRALAACGGAVGINLYDPFVRDGGGATARDVIRHVEHFLSLGGENAVGLGCDFDGMDRPSFQLENVSALGRLVEEMEKNALSPEQIRKITHENFLRFLESFT